MSVAPHDSFFIIFKIKSINSFIYLFVYLFFVYSQLIYLLLFIYLFT